MIKEPIYDFIYNLCKLVCHQKKSRCFKIKGHYMPICARCTGILIAFLLSITLLFFNIYINFYIALLLFLPMAIDWSIQSLKIKNSNNTRRFITGLFGGIGMCYIFYYIITFLLSFLNIK